MWQYFLNPLYEWHCIKNIPRELNERSSALSNDTSTKKEVNNFCGGIQVLFQKAQEICNSDQVISSAEQLEELEQKVGDLTDQLQAVIIEKRLQSSLDSEEVRETEADLVANLPSVFVKQVVA